MNLRLSGVAIAVAIGMLLSPGILRADPPSVPPAQPAAAPALPAAAPAQAQPAQAQPAPAPAQPEFNSQARGIVVGAGFGYGSYGEGIPGIVGAQTTGIKTYGGRELLVNWNLLGGVVGGYAGNEHPGFIFLGGKLDAGAEGGYRFMPKSNWSPYAGMGGKLQLSLVGVLGGGDPRTANNLDGLAGVNGALTTRSSFGASYLNPRHSILLTAFVQEAVRAPGSLDRENTYNEAGVHVQYDLKQSLSIMAEALYGRTAEQTDPAFSSTMTKDRLEAMLAVRKMFGKWWVALDGKIVEEGSKTIYSNAPNTYETHTTPSPEIHLTVGIPIK